MKPRIPTRRRRAAAQVLAVAVAALLAGAAHAQRSPIAVPKRLPADLTPRIALGECGHFKGHYGPMDYRTADMRDRGVVEEFHFEVELRTFLAGKVSGANMAGTGPVVYGFQYTLKSFPNHPAALLVMEQLGRKLKSENPQGIEIPLECWFMRAFMIAPDDPAVRAIYGVYLVNRNRDAEALANLKLGDAGTHNSPSLQHQIGSAYFQLRQYELAQLCALRLARRNFPIDALERQLRDAGKWNPNLSLPPEERVNPDDPAAPPADAAASSPAAPVAAAPAAPAAPAASASRP